MSNYWTKLTGAKIATLQEEVTSIVNLPISSGASVTTTLISGELPAGMRLKNNQIVGTPNPVPRITTSTFVIRATGSNNNIEDRTFKITIEGADDPEWVTPEGNLPVGGENRRYFVLDNEIIHFQLQATDLDLPAGQQLEYYIDKNDGELPGGITLSSTGLLSGVVDPLLVLDADANKGAYDTNRYDGYAFDFTSISSYFFNGEFFENAVFDAPKKLNRYYQFRVSANDGDTVVKRQFTIYVVGDDFLRADNVLIQVGTGVFTTDSTYLRTPVWLTNRNIGFRRADNYITIFLDTLKNNLQQGVMRYVLQSTNDDGSASTLPPGLTLDASTGEVAGRIPYQPSVTVEYKFTVRAELIDERKVQSYKDKTFTVKILGKVDSTITWKTATNLGSLNANFASVFRVEATSTVVDAPLLYRKTGGRLPPGLTLQFDGEITGNVRQFGTTTPTTLSGLTIFDNGILLLDGNDTTVDREYKFTVEAKDRFGYSAVTKEFKINVIDENDLLYSNLYMKPFMDETTRASYRSLISNPNIFPAGSLYRPNDAEFGLQKEVKILAYAGLETKSLDTFFASSQKWHKKKRYKVGNIKTALAKTPGTTDTVYEVIYAEVKDPAESTTNKRTRKSFNIKGTDVLTVDQAGVFDINNRDFEHDGIPLLKTGEQIFNRDPLISSSRFRPFDRFLDVYGIKLVGTPAIGGAKANTNEFIKKVARTVTLLLDPEYGGTQTSSDVTKQMQVINYMKEFKTAQKIGWQGTSSYNPSIVADNAGTNYEGLTKFNYNYNTVDYIWEQPNGSTNGDQQILEVLEHLIHTITVFGLSYNGALNQMSQSSDLYNAMVEAINNNMFDISNYSGTFPGTDANFRALLMREYLYLLILGNWNYVTQFVASGSLQPEWHDNMRTPEGILANNPLGSALYTNHIENVITKPSISSLRETFADNAGGVANYTPQYLTTSPDQSNNHYFFNTTDTTLNVGEQVIDQDGSSVLTAVSDTDSQNFNQGQKRNIPLADSDAIKVSGGNEIRYISNISNMQDSLRAIGVTAYGFLPLWMRTPQTAGEQESGFTLAIPLCYCKPGTSATILTNINNSGFDFKKLDLEVDRYIVDSTTGNSEEQYILFANYEYNA